MPEPPAPLTAAVAALEAAVRGAEAEAERTRAGHPAPPGSPPLARAAAGTRAAGGAAAVADLAAPGAAESVFRSVAARGGPHNRELIFLAVGDTVDHRRSGKDDSISALARDFLTNQILNLDALGVRHHLVLASSARLCGSLLQGLRDEDPPALTTCVTSSHWADDPRLKDWGLAGSDMLVLWAATWRAVASAVAWGYGALRVDADVYFHEDPYPILRGPLLREAALVTQQDIVGSGQPLWGPLAWTGRARCAPPAPTEPWPHGRLRPPGVPLTACNQQRPPWINCGFVYARPRPNGTALGGGALAVLNETWTSFDAALSQRRAAGGSPASEVLNDQVLFRKALKARGVGLRDLKHPDAWLVIPGDAAPVYEPGSGDCPHGAGCGEVARLRAAVPFKLQLLRPGPYKERAVIAVPSRTDAMDMVAAAPDWLVGRLCVITVPPSPAGGAAGPPRTGQSVPPPLGCWPHGRPGVPHPFGAALAATHMVYTKAAKRRLAFDAFGWWRLRRRPEAPQGPCSGGDGGVLFGHTFLGPHNTSASATPVLCSGKRDAGGCPCCSPLPQAQGAALPPRAAELRDKLLACDAWQEFFDL
eukprot:TRINITY_DN12518_c1_g2_i2.p1 TRINITY_DN12518_c1_g2~~TRINITY_DN12518_c1_g2_i2.p1  ORF type:complete len:597 (+),score=119.43 TRINITY_DN12518_c1_g2_i2:24-1793(+)